jgi:hypothetical protein
MNQVIKEKYRTGDGHFWKLPGGLCDAGEDIAKCAVREVWLLMYTQCNKSLRTAAVLFLFFLKIRHCALHGCSRRRLETTQAAAMASYANKGTTAQTLETRFGTEPGKLY